MLAKKMASTQDTIFSINKSNVHFPSELGRSDLVSDLSQTKWLCPWSVVETQGQMYNQELKIVSGKMSENY